MVVNKPYKKGLIPGRVTKHLQELLKLVAKDYALWKSYEIVPLKKNPHALSGFLTNPYLSCANKIFHLARS